MTGSGLVLFHFPGACSRVALFALEETGQAHDVTLVNLAAGEQLSPAHIARSPLGKVPILGTPDGYISENAAILTYIAALAPEAGLFPADQSPLAQADRQAGLSFCGGTLHPIVRGLLNPARLTDGDPEGVRQRSTELAKKSFGYAQDRLAARDWWLGNWSLIDVYLCWAVSIAKRAGFSFDQMPLLDGLDDRLMQRPAYARTMAREAEYSDQLAKAGG